MALFRLTRNAAPIAEIALEKGMAAGKATDVSELQLIGFEVEDAEPDTEYLVAIGDIDADPGAMSVHHYSEVGRRRRTTVFWEDRHWFESARGFVLTRLFSRPASSNTEWNERCRVSVYVLPSKLGEARYRGLISTLGGLTAGLLVDLVGKATRGVGESSGRLPPRLPHLELAALEETWREVRAGLREIQREPAIRLSRRRELANCWGSERISAASVARLASVGINPRHPASSRPFPAVRERLEESVETEEHRAIRGILDVLDARLSDCRASIDADAKALEADRAYRDRSPDGSSPSLYETYDVPRLARLHRFEALAANLKREIASARRGPILAGLPARQLTLTPVFANVAAYRRVYRAAARFLASSPIIIDEGDELRVKATSRLYEQWVFLQICIAFHRAGLAGETVDQLVTQIEHSRRFVLDLQRGTSLTYEASEDRRVRVRYEPYVFGRVFAARHGHTVYRGVHGDVPWSPDVLIEVLTADRVPRVEYAVVIDAKYARQITGRHWEGANKYRQIRGTADDRQIVRQLWLAYPGKAEEIVPTDPAVTWTVAGPDRPREEAIEGVLSTSPPECDTLEDEDAMSSEVVLSPTILQFVTGLVAFLGLRADAAAV